MRCSKLIVPLAFLSVSTLSAYVNSDNNNAEDYSVGAEVISDSQLAQEESQRSHDKSTNKLGVNALQDEDNHPTPDHLKKPLDPYNNGGRTSDHKPESELTGDSNNNYNAFLMSISMIVVSEIGDKTFLIAALMAMRNSRVIVFSAAFSSLVVMTILSGIVGHALPTLISQRITQFLASILFIIFGFKLLKEGLSMSKDLGVEEELAEVEEEIASNKINLQLNDMEGGRGSQSQSHSLPPKGSKQWFNEIGSQVQNLASFIFTPVWIQVFVMTFLGEWGDRSQIATIAMAAGSEYWFVILGAIIGHGLCTAAACIGGKFLAKKISMRNVTLGGAIAFFVFAILYFYDAYYNIES
ncbi:GDT1 [Candida pseudojiufengensis]|uniref:GDT1 n=1 Tax=Candida pseudojiufengensis TaxID=497109 RepID=UPI00222519B1|nr:GDT1 [Candida pseudojiufengensis]KAI5966356.1 GDT1 [Candida pseudojiufengensis]